MFNLRVEIQKINEKLESKGFGLQDLTILECASASLTGEISRKQIFESVQKGLSKEWTKCRNSLYKSVDFLRLANKVPVSKFIPNEVILAPLSFFFYHNSRPNARKLSHLENFFWKASFSQRYIEGQSAKVSDDIKLMKHLGEHDAPSLKGFKWLADFEIPRIKDLIEHKLSFRSALSKSVLCMYSTNGPRDFATNQPVDLVESFSDANTRQLHHIFPKNFLKKRHGSRVYKNKIKPFEDSIMNICLISAASNKSIQDKSPCEYVAILGERNKKIVETLRTHLIYDKAYSKMLSVKFMSFLKERAKIIRAEIRKKTAVH